VKELTDFEKRAVRDLIQSDGWRILIDNFEEYLSSLLTDLVRQENPFTVLRMTRQWQIVRRLVNALQAAPLSVIEEMEASGKSYDYPEFVRPLARRSRFEPELKDDQKV
jgi:hypothetical protein